MLNRKCLLLGVVLAAGLLIVPNPLGADEEGSRSGYVFGAWDLPASQREPGWAAAYLYNLQYEPQLLFLAELQERPSPTNNRMGPIYGLLFDMTMIRPLYYVDGVWQGPRNATTGTWSATLYSLETLRAVGQMRGNFTDPAPFEVGRYGDCVGSWRIER